MDLYLQDTVQKVEGNGPQLSRAENKGVPFLSPQ